MTRIDSSPERDSPSSSHSPDLAATTTTATEYPKSKKNASASAALKRTKRSSASLACCKATFFTVLIVFISYFWLSWTDPDEIARRQRAWDAAMERIRGKQVIHAPRYNEQYRFRPAASPIITETLKDGRKKIRGGRPGDSDDKPPKPTPTTPRKPNRKKTKNTKSGKNRKKN